MRVECSPGLQFSYQIPCREKSQCVGFGRKMFFFLRDDKISLNMMLNSAPGIKLVATYSSNGYLRLQCK